MSELSNICLFIIVFAVCESIAKVSVTNNLRQRKNVRGSVTHDVIDNRNSLMREPVVGLEITKSAKQV